MQVQKLVLNCIKAFDTVDHDMLLNKLESIGVRGISLILFASYLLNRTQIVRVDDKQSGQESSSRRSSGVRSWSNFS